MKATKSGKPYSVAVFWMLAFASMTQCSQARPVFDRRLPSGLPRVTRHCERSEAIDGSAAARPPIGPRLVRPHRGSLKRLLHDRFWEFVGGPSRREMDCFATLAITGSARSAGVTTRMSSSGTRELPSRSAPTSRARRSRRSRAARPPSAGSGPSFLSRRAARRGSSARCPHPRRAARGDRRRRG
jgi:hypothetical protein